ncbi:protein phosphatase 1 regulatory subunit 12A isoform X2 [Megalops cyprinoides]|uniref:protein phosphatase 1 regulatory subunit 12A isoform X2 n=1 Tax=Megalops cyprinoides TaxID=118141 RepID=UPI0018643682|nr:protein phosphatase 1 regulatory subunit 12A isoform X2 [Megalops cyprinoides]
MSTLTTLILRQACIDENVEVVQFLVESGSDINRGDNEGWTPLHAAASCGFLQIAKYLIEHGAQVGAVNSEGELPLDVATEEAMERLLKDELKKQGVDVESARQEEERVMLQDAMVMLAGHGTLTPHPNTGATALHVAAAKGYTQVMNVLLQCGLDVDSRDIDGWTPLHAAAHWGQEEACSLLVDSMSDMGAVNKVGQTPIDVADERLLHVLEDLQKKQNNLRSKRHKMSQIPVIQNTCPVATVPVRSRRTSICRMSSKEKNSLHERERHTPPALQSTPAEEEEEGQSTLQGPAGGFNSSSSEERSESESDTESERMKNREMNNNISNSSTLPTVTATSAGTSHFRKVEVGKAPGPEVPGSWRTTLRKAGSYVALSGTGALESPKESAKGPDSQGMIRSASSPRLSLESDSKEPRLARVPPTPTRRLFSIADSNPDNSNSGLTRSSSYTRRLTSQAESDLTSPAYSMICSSSFGRKLNDPSVTSVTKGTSSGVCRLNSLTAQRPFQEQKEKKDLKSTATSNSLTMTTCTLETKNRRKSYLTPVRDEEAEAQRKARSRHARQSRRSTQGVTLTDLQEAEKSMKTEQKEREKKKEEEERDGKLKKGEEGEVTWRFRIANLQKSDLLGLTSPPGGPRHPTAEGRDGHDSGTGDSEDRASRERRRVQARRGGAPGAGESDDNEPSREEEGAGSGGDPRMQSTVRNTSRCDVSCNDRIFSRSSETNDYKKLFEEVSQENGKLQSQLQDTQRTVSQTRVDLDKATQRQERFSDCSALLDLERKERRILERRVAELEEELKVLGDLRADNQRLKDENGALIRVISKLSK